MDPAIPVDANNAPTGIWNAAQNSSATSCISFCGGHGGDAESKFAVHASRLPAANG